MDQLNEVIMAINTDGVSTVGCCYYVAREERLLFMEDAKFGGIDMVDALKVYIEPTVVIVSNKMSDEMLEKIDPDHGIAISEGGSNGRLDLPFFIEFRPSNEFSHDFGQSKLASLNILSGDGPGVTFIVPGDVVPATANIADDSSSFRQRQLLRLASWISLDSHLSVGCAGALLAYVQRRRAIAYLPGDVAANAMFRISSLEMFSLRDIMFVNTDTLHSLQILGSEAHPNSHNQGPTQATSGSKEGLSVYGLFRNLACTPQGKCLLRQYFLRPSLNIDIINERLDAIATFVRPDNDAILDSLIRDLRPIKNIRTILINLKKGVGSATTGGGKSNILSKTLWINVREFAFRTLKIKDTFNAMLESETLPIRRKVLEHFVGPQLCQLGKRINDIIDFDRSEDESRTIIRAGVDEELDHMKRTFDGLGSLLAEVERKLAEDIPHNLRQTLNVIYFPQIGFLTTTPIDPETREVVYEGGFENPWERMFATEDQCYFKNSQMREMDDHFGDLFGLISDREIEICHELTQYTLKYEGLLTTTSDICSELDSLIALARGAKLYSLCRPDVSMDNSIRIRNGRHILQELTVPSFVPNDTQLSGGEGDEGLGSEGRPTSIASNCPASARWSNSEDSEANMVILTGPNYSGKSVYLKQVALIVFMSHVGSFVPAESAEIGLTDKILSRVTTRETVSRTGSTFMIDLQQISLALSLATRRSLLVLDEIGKGTDSSDGAGLACAVLEHLTSLGLERPKVVAATHFHVEIFESGIFQPRHKVSFGHMEVRVNPEARVTEDQVTHLYNFRKGRSNSSFGTWCAAANGVPSEIVQRAADLTTLSARGEDLVTACSTMPESEVAELEAAVSILPACCYLTAQHRETRRRLREPFCRPKRTMMHMTYCIKF
ncbi:hypothetical protein BU24DRAFT_341301 [Aaosphaeria arxii CBS 175.79]|uniref:DNA mismatch repair proteins mutS family domain-containing protein n=1 Tax=Aaosphaeria arxii CBS 175.79 TaxID=1450172 RepID=A0A6A5Y0I5_9PLEO|nr:uncharacterized protein BU24DRAFT_341301 [Aaosphaeria arxii CBS 175.79]KAF2019048.1 hypothetical protein BU24DRAFT_341301 [Aaosphaeria arxii CBS 175.79]